MSIFISHSEPESASDPSCSKAATEKAKHPGSLVLRSRIVRGWTARGLVVLLGIAIVLGFSTVLARGNAPIPTLVAMSPAVLLAALLDGVWSGILLTLASPIAKWMWAAALPEQSITPHANTWLTTVIFVSFGVSLSIAIEYYHRNRERLAAYWLNAAVETELRQAENERKLADLASAERERLTGVLETLPSMVSLLDKRYRVVFANSSYRQRFGDFEGSRCFEARFGRAEPCERCETFLPLETGLPHQWEVTLPDGSILELHEFPFSDRDGTELILECGLDVTDQRRAGTELRTYRERLEELVSERTRELQAAKAQLETEVEQMARAQEKIAQSQATLNAALASMPDSVIIADVAGNFVDFNDAFTSLGGSQEKTTIPHSVDEFVAMFEVSYPDGRVLPREELAFVRALNGEKRDNVEYILRRRDNGATWTRSLSFGPIRNRNGAILGAIITGRDITEAKRVESRLRRIYETDLFAILYWKIEGEVVNANDRFLAMTGYTRQDLEAGRINWAQITPPEFWRLDEDARRQVRETGVHQPYEKQLVRKDGKRIWGQFWAAAYEDDRTQGISFILDITKRKQAELELEEAKQQAERNAAQLRTIFDSMEERVYVCDPQGKLIVANNVARRTYQREGNAEPPSVEEMPGYIEVYTADGQPLDRAEWPISRVLRGERFHGVEIRVHYKHTGQTRILSSSGAPVCDKSGKMVMGVLTSADVTERKAIEAALRESEKVASYHEQLQALAKHLSHAREEERTRVSRDLHDQIGQILTAIKMDLMWMSKRSNDPEMQNRLKGSIELIGEGARSVRAICSGLRPHILDDLGLAAAIEWQANEFHARTGINCELEVKPGDLRPDTERTTAFFRIFQECLTNVSRHADASCVQVCLFEDGNSLILQVRDNGKGFCESKVSGSLGILGMKERARTCGGEIEIQSGPGEGTTVRVRIPVGDREGEINAHSDR